MTCLSQKEIERQFQSSQRRSLARRKTRRRMPTWALWLVCALPIAAAVFVWLVLR